jgi:hypothetical protein
LLLRDGGSLSLLGRLADVTLDDLPAHEKDESADDPSRYRVVSEKLHDSGPCSSNHFITCVASINPLVMMCVPRLRVSQPPTMQMKPTTSAIITGSRDMS